MAAKRNALERTLQKARSLLASYVTPGRKSAEATLEELLRVLRQARGVVALERKRIGSPRRRKRSARSASATTVKRSGARTKRRGAAAAGPSERRTTARSKLKRTTKAARKSARKGGKRARA